MTSIPALLHHRATTTAAQTALASIDGHSLSFAALWQQVGDVGRVLRAHGVRRSNRVAVALPTGPAMAATFLGVASAATCAPLNPAYKRADFDFYLDDLRPAAVVLPAGSESPLADAARERGLPILYVEALPPETERVCRIAGDAGPAVGTNGAQVARLGEPEADDIALILHTSGTTSRPKMVPLTHANLCASAQGVARTLRLTVEDRCLNVMPLFHIHGLVGGLLASLAAGSGVVSAPGFASEHFIGWACDHAATWYTAVPTIHQAILEAAARTPEQAQKVRFRLIRSSSSALPPSVLAALEEQWGAPVIESYGMSEAAHQIASNPLPPGQRKPGSVGPAAGPDVAVMDEAGRLLGEGQRGEVVIRGASVTRGYEQNPEANAKAFTDGWLRTGDEGYLDADGYLFLTGRLKEMINRGGENIAPREIDEALLAHPAVAQAVAFAVPHETLGDDLAAAVVLRPGAAVREQQLRFFVAERLADFKVPSRIVLVDAVPKGATGKLQRIGLHEKLAPHLVAEYAAPTTEEEQQVADAFAEVLSVERVGRDDNFFALGGDSIRAIRTVAALGARVGYEVAVARLFKFPTPASLGEELRRLSEEAAELEALAHALQELSPEEAQRLLSESESDA